MSARRDHLRSGRLSLPDDIPVAACSLAALRRLGEPAALSGFALNRALALKTSDKSDPVSVWAAPSLRAYRDVWNAACRAHLVDALSEWGDNVDVDHLFPRSWVKIAPAPITYVRLFPVWAEVNRSAGAGREKSALTASALDVITDRGIVYATELQVLKLLGHPVGNSSEPISIFEG